MQVWKQYETLDGTPARVPFPWGTYGPEPWLDHAAPGSTVADALERSDVYRHRLGIAELVAVYSRADAV